jgi:membrane-associated phospholipid phosphatase
MDNREERIVPFLFTGLVYLGVTYLMLYTLKMNAIIVMLMAGITLTVILVSFVTLFWKISAHAAAISGVIVLLFFLNQEYAEGQFYNFILGLIIVAGILCSARLYLNSHSPLQVMGGTLLGISTAVFSFYILL